MEGNGNTSMNLNAVGTWVGLGFIPSASKTVSKVHVPINSVTGTLAGTDITCDIYSSASSAPNASIESRSSISATLATGAYGIWTGFTTALTAGTMYWFVLKNVNIAPTLNNVTIRRGTGQFVPDYFFWPKTSTNSGGAWSDAGQRRATFWVEYSDGSAEGFPFLSSTNSGTSTRIFSTHENGDIFTVPAGPTLPVIGIECSFMQSVGTPTGDLRFRLWGGSSPSLLGTTYSIPVAQVISGGQGVYQAMFSSAINITPGQIVRMTVAETTQSDTNANAYQANELTIDSDALSLAMMPFRGTMQQTYFDGTSWTQTSNVIIPMRIILDSSQEIGIGGGVSRARAVAGV